MTDDNITLENRKLKMSGTYTAENLSLKAARVEEGISKLTDTKIEFLCKDRKVALDKIVGFEITLELENGDEEDRKFTGRCISAEFIGLYEGMGHYIAECKSFFWFLTRGRENRVFQEMTVLDIMQEIMQDYGFWTDVDNRTSGTYEERLYCVQYRESDFDFLSRLMEEEGIYYYFINENGREKMVLGDGQSSHSPTPGPEGADFEFHFRDGDFRRRADHIFDWNAVERQTTGKVTLNDYDFESPKADKKKARNRPYSNNLFERRDKNT